VPRPGSEDPIGAGGNSNCFPHKTSFCTNIIAVNSIEFKQLFFFFLNSFCRTSGPACAALKNLTYCSCDLHCGSGVKFNFLNKCCLKKYVPGQPMVWCFIFPIEGSEFATHTLYQSYLLYGSGTYLK
jgi:hypothetical protein